MLRARGFLFALMGLVLLACGAAPAAVEPAAPSRAEVIAPASPAAAVWSDADSPVPVSSLDAYSGNRDALVTLVTFSDFECMYCARAARTFKKLRAAYGPEKLRMVWKHEPLSGHPNALPAAEASQGVLELGGLEAFWKFHELAFDNQDALNTDSYFVWAGAAGVRDIGALRLGLESNKWRAKVKLDHQLAAAVGVPATPASFINGVLLVGAKPYEAFASVVDAELVLAEARVAAGTRRDQIYVARSKEQFRPAPPEEDEPEVKEDTVTVHRIPVGKSPTLGLATAPVTLVVFSDFECKFCQMIEPTLARVREVYGPKVRLVWKDNPLPFHKRATPAAMLAHEARVQKGDAGFWAAHDKLFASQPKLEDSDLEAIAKDLGLNVKAAMAAVQNSKHEDSVDADLDLAEAFAVEGTPQVFVNGRRLNGAQPFEKFQAVIDHELVRSQVMLSNGTPVSKLYDEMIKGGVAPKELTFPSKTAAAPIGLHAIRGPANAKVVIELFSDFQCPFCNRVRPTLDKVLRKFGSKVRIVWRDLPLVAMHPQAALAAEAGREALAQKGNAGFWAMHDKLFSDPKTLGREQLDRYASELSLDMSKFKAALDGRTHQAEVQTDMDAAKAAEIHGTPHCLINGRQVSGAQRYGHFKKAIELALAERK
jgi:protein-disulfide isomerase